MANRKMINERMDVLTAEILQKLPKNKRFWFFGRKQTTPINEIVLKDMIATAYLAGQKAGFADGIEVGKMDNF